MVMTIISEEMLYNKCEKLKVRFPMEYDIVKHWLDNLFKAQSKG